jgi:hypothetical protein
MIKLYLIQNYVRKRNNKFRKTAIVGKQNQSEEKLKNISTSWNFDLHGGEVGNVFHKKWNVLIPKLFWN